MWTYSQRTGILLHDNVMIGTGYSGFGVGKNNPIMQDVHNVGPIPQGRYSIGQPEDLEGGPHGPFVLPLTPDPTNEMFGRSGFLIHGDSEAHPGQASQGCVIMSRPVRDAIQKWGDSELEVTE